jgi:hypothetical protein
VNNLEELAYWERLGVFFYWAGFPISFTVRALNCEEQ